MFFKDDWKCDQHRWVNNKVARLPKKNPVIKKTYFVLDSPIGPCNEFKKHAYELLPSNNYVLIHYLGDEKASIPFAHRNKKNNTDQPFIRTCPSTIETMKNECKTSTAAKVYRKGVVMGSGLSHQSVMQPKNYQQADNLRNRHLRLQRISHDSLYSIHELAIDIPEFVHKIETHPDLLCICGHSELLEEFDRVLTLDSDLPQLISYDTTFNLGDFYVSVLAFRHTLFSEWPVMPAAFLIHERKFRECHEKFLVECVKHVPTLQKESKPIVTDDEKGIVESIKTVLPNLKWLRCWNHLFQDVRRWLRNHGAPSQDIEVYIANLRKLFHKSSESEYQKELQEVSKKWSAPFGEYYAQNIHSQIMFIGRWAIEEMGSKLYSPYSGNTNNQSEGLNHVLKSLHDWHEVSVDSLMLSLYYLQGYYLSEIALGQNGLGIYHVHPRFSKMSFASLSMSQVKYYQPDEIVSRIKGELSKPKEEDINTDNSIDTTQLPDSSSKKARALKLIEDGKIVHNPKLKVFTIAGSKDCYVTKLHPNESCTCPAKKDCYHIFAAKMSIGMDLESKRKPSYNLAELMRNVRRKKKEKKSGRKQPRQCDIEVIAAPDAVSSVDKIESESCIKKANRKRIREGDTDEMEQKSCAKKGRYVTYVYVYY